MDAHVRGGASSRAWWCLLARARRACAHRSEATRGRCRRVRRRTRREIVKACTHAQRRTPRVRERKRRVTDSDEVALRREGGREDRRDPRSSAPPLPARSQRARSSVSTASATVGADRARSPYRRCDRDRRAERLRPTTEATRALECKQAQNDMHALIFKQHEGVFIDTALMCLKRDCKHKRWRYAAHKF
jgi:hypothetical protein